MNFVIRNNITFSSILIFIQTNSNSVSKHEDDACFDWSCDCWSKELVKGSQIGVFGAGVNYAIRHECGEKWDGRRGSESIRHARGDREAVRRK